MKLRWLVKEYPGGIKSPPVLQYYGYLSKDPMNTAMGWIDIPTEVIQMEVKEQEKGNDKDK